MQKITGTIELKEMIRILEIKQVHQEILLKEQFKNTYESLKPANLIKRKFNELITAPDLKGDLLNIVLSVAAGYFSKKVIVGTTHNPLKQLLGSLLQMTVTDVVSKNADGIKSTFGHLLTTILSKKSTAV